MADSSASSQPTLPAFLAGGGDTARRIAALDGSDALGPLAAWPESLKATLSIVVHSPIAMALLWGPQGVMLYNDAYAEMAGARHPAILGRPVLEAWPEGADLNREVMETALNGGRLSFRDRPLRLFRHGRPEDTWFNLDYSPVIGEGGRPAGVIAVVTETTERVLAERGQAEMLARQQRLFEQTPGFDGAPSGLEHVVEFVAETLRARTRREALLRLTDELRDLDDVAQIAFAASRVLGEALGASRVGYGAFDADTDTLHVERDWTAPGVESLAGATPLGAYGSFVDRLKRDEVIDIADVREDEGTAAVAPRLEAGLARAFINAPIIEHGRLVALLFVDFAQVRVSADADLALVQDVAQRTRIAVERARATAALRRREAELREANETLEQRVAAALAERRLMAELFERADTFIQVLDSDFHFLAINTANAEEYFRIFGFRPRAGDNLMALLADRPDLQAPVREIWARAMAGETFTTTQEFGDPARGARTYEIRFSPWRDADGQVVGAYQLSHDVTERRLREERLAEAEEQLRQAQKMEAIGQLTGGVAHDFNNLLTVITGGLSLLDSSTDPQRRRRVMDGMRQAADRGASLSRQLLSFSRRQPLKAEPTDLWREIGAMEDLLNRALRGDVQVRTDFAADLWPVEIDPAELELAILNLCVNSRDAMPEGGVITIGAHNAPGLVHPRLDGDFVRLTVIDTGVGMPPDVLGRAFEPFFTTKDVGKGSGLGLPQVYGFARQSGGAVHIDSRPGEGTAVTLLLPRSARVPAHPPEDRRDRDGAGARPARAGSVLLVEDDDEVAALVGEMLQQLGYQPIRAATPDAALGALADYRQLELVFSDVVMPGPMNGVDLAREIRRRRPDLPVLLTSGYADAALSQAGEDQIELVRKPYDLDTLRHALSRTLASAATGPGRRAQTR